MPLVTTPPPAIWLPERAVPPAGILKATSLSLGPAARTRATASPPMKPVASLQHQLRPEVTGSRSSPSSVSVEVKTGLEAKRVAGAEPGGAAP